MNFRNRITPEILERAAEHGPDVLSDFDPTAERTVSFYAAIFHDAQGQAHYFRFGCDHRPNHITAMTAVGHHVRGDWTLRKITDAETGETVWP